MNELVVFVHVRRKRKKTKRCCWSNKSRERIPLKFIKTYRIIRRLNMVWLSGLDKTHLKKIVLLQIK